LKKLFLFLVIFLTCLSNVRTQNIYVSDIWDIWRLNPDNCSYSFVIHVNDYGLFDIAFDTSGNLYGISGYKLLKINTINGNVKTITIFPDSSPLNAMTISAQNVVYVAGSDGGLFSYDIKSDVQSYLGNIGYGAAGDLTFYHGDMYMAAHMNRLIKVNIEDPSLSTLEFSYPMNGAVLGIVSDFRDCDDVDVFAVSNIQNGQSEIYRINFTEKKLEYICLLPKSTGGGASTTEFMASILVKIGTIIKTDANCQNQNGRIEIINSSGHGEIGYSINNGAFQETTVFDGLSAGSYWIQMIDQLGCQDSTLVILQQAFPPNIDSVFIQPSICNESNGQLTITASGGSGDLSYSLDSISFHSSPVFDHLPPQSYSVWIRDTAGCTLREDVEIGSLQSSQILSVEITGTTCARNNGAILVLVDNESGTLYSIDGVNFQSNSFFPNLMDKRYLVTIHDLDGCIDTISAFVAPSSIPEIELIDISPASCNEDNGSMSLSGKLGVSPYRFAIDGLGFYNTGLFDSLSPGSHEAMIIDQAGCLDSILFQIPAIDLPNFESIEILSTTCLNANGSISSKVGGGVEPLVVSLYTDQQEKLNHFNFLSAGNYILNVEDKTGCSVDSLVRVKSAGCPVYIPNVFSPNGDGINDLFGIELVESNDIESIELSIYDRWGNLVFHQKSEGQISTIKYWDGSFQEKPCSVGVYAYLAVLVRKAQENDILQGTITLIK
jgi:gliding motility-associated-like protein